MKFMVKNESLKKISLVTVLGILTFTAFVSSCGWFTYDDIPETKVYYDAFDNIVGIHDSTLLMSRLPTNQEINKNIFIPFSEEENLKFQGPIPFGYDEEYFRDTGITRSLP